MPGLYVLSSWEPLPLKSSKVKACANGYSLSITAHLVYSNPHEEPMEGKRELPGTQAACLPAPLKAPMLGSILISSPPVSWPSNLAQFGEQRQKLEWGRHW